MAGRCNIHPPQPFHIPAIDLQHLAADAQEAELRAITIREGQRPFDLASGPLLRLNLVHLAPDDQVLVITEHHLIHDGWTQGVFLRDFSGDLRGASRWHDTKSPRAADPVRRFCPLAAGLDPGARCEMNCWHTGRRSSRAPRGAGATARLPTTGDFRVLAGISLC